MWVPLLSLAAAVPATLAGVVHLRGRRPSRPAATAPLTAIVLGARVAPDGSASPALKGRVQAAVALLRSGAASRLVLSGGSPDARATEAFVMASLARAQGVPAAQLVLEPDSRSTFENAANCTRLLRAEGIKEALLVTCDFHMARATAQFRASGLTVMPWPVQRSLSAATRLMVTAHEVVGLLRRPHLVFHL